ncbi:unnamed protein product [Paramecium sonneborni]|uniref:Uncharacterized protein n=1 Tax=Paramecium sonneborni TaxID=65129 RepID=A0A8S1QE65_9CILI|nr:unnamed protein product [Paramecium sonneborni]
MIGVYRKGQISDILGFISKPFNFKLYESFINQKVTISDIHKKNKNIMNILRNILDHPFYKKNDFSTKAYENERLKHIKKILGLNRWMIFLCSQYNSLPLINNLYRVNRMHQKQQIRRKLIRNIKILRYQNKENKVDWCQFRLVKLQEIGIQNVNINGMNIYVMLLIN